jgi:UDP-2,3-diacylglucosamine hydrolase
MYLNIENSAIFIADSHFNINRLHLQDTLLNIKSKKIKTTQLFLMGDIFDFLSDDIEYFQNLNKDIINIINELSNDINIIYLEGNHDFNLFKTFPNIQIIPRKSQPLLCKYNNLTISLAHGDIFMPKAYNIYTTIIRSQIMKVLLNFIDINHFIFKKLNLWLLQKNICGTIEDFDTFAQKRIDKYAHYNVDIIIEGHFHQDKRYKNYINLPSLVCNKRYYSSSAI